MLFRSVVDLDPECFLDDRRGAFETDSQAVGIAMGDPKTLAGGPV